MCNNLTNTFQLAFCHILGRSILALLWNICHPIKTKQLWSVLTLCEIGPHLTCQAKCDVTEQRVLCETEPLGFFKYPVLGSVYV